MRLGEVQYFKKYLINWLARLSSEQAHWCDSFVMIASNRQISCGVVSKFDFGFPPKLSALSFLYQSEPPEH